MGLAIRTSMDDVKGRHLVAALNLLLEEQLN